MGISVFPTPASGIQSSDLITQPVFTAIASTSASNVSAVTISGLSGYNMYRVYITNFLPTTSDILTFRFNGDTSNSYSFNQRGLISSALALTNYFSEGWNSQFMFTSTSTNQGYYTAGGYLDIYNANSTSVKQIRTQSAGTNAADRAFYNDGYGIYAGTSTISSITIRTSNGYNFYANNIYVLGGK